MPLNEEVGVITPDTPVFCWHTNSIDACIAALGLSRDSSDDLLQHGLSTEEAKQRLQKYGRNKLTEKEGISLLQRIWKLNANVLVGILVFVAVVSVTRAATSKTADDIISNWLQVALIVFVITINTIIGIIQEGSAERASDALKAMLSAEAVVVRDGVEVKISAEELVPGDIVKLGLGDRVPADLRLCKVGNLACGEAALTGESLPVDKTVDAIVADGDPMTIPLGDRHNMCFSATLVTQGTGTGLVISTGDVTEIGTINALVNTVEQKKTNVLKQIDTIYKYYAVFIFMTVAPTWCVAYFITGQGPLDALSTSLVCAAAMVPSGLEAIVTMTYGWAVGNMAKKNAIIRALPAVETLGSVTVICSDKTGTLTKNEMTLTAFVTSGKRYKFKTDASIRASTNFVVDNEYLHARADNTKFLQATETGKPRGKTVLGFGEPAHSDGEPDEPITVLVNTADIGDVKATSLSSGSVEHPDAAFLRQALSGGILCSKCNLGPGGAREGEIGSPTELSILRAAYFGDVDVSDVKDSAPFIAEVPFSSEYKFMATVHEPIAANDTDDYSDSLIVHVKGAPDRMLPMCKYQAKDGRVGISDRELVDVSWWTEQIAILSSHGLRVLALARGAIPVGSVRMDQQLGPDFVLERGEPWLTVVGLCAIMDPPRSECIVAISEAHGAGVRVAMITGDHKDTALAIGGMLGLVDKQHPDALTGPEMDAMTDEELTVAVQKFNIFSRASPQNKILIVKALQAEGDICGMTGDGVNDAPALKAADMGVAMGKEGTDVAREASDMILADDNFATIVSAIHEGRVVWDNLRKVLLVNSPLNNAQGMSVFFGLLLGLETSPLTSIQVLYCNLACACTLCFVCAVEPAEPGIMEQPPRRTGKRLIGRFLFLRIIIATIALTAATVGAAFWVSGLGYDAFEQHSQALNTLAFGSCSITFSARFSRKSALHRRSFEGNPLAFWSSAIMLVLQVFITYCPGVNSVVFSMAPMDGFQWAVVIIMMIAVILVMEIEKCISNYLTVHKFDVDDREYDKYFDDSNDNDESLPPSKKEPDVVATK